MLTALHSRFRFFILLLSLPLTTLYTVPQMHAQQSAEASSDDPVKLFEQGQSAHMNGDLARALELYDAALRTHEEFPEAHYQRGAALASLHRDADAEQAFRRAITLRPDWLLPQTALGLLLARDPSSRSRADEAKALLQKTIASDNQNLPALSALARINTFNGDKATSLELLRRATSLQNATADLWFERALAERAAGNTAEAAASLERAIALDAQFLPARIERADMLLGKPGEGKTDGGSRANNEAVANELRSIETILAARKGNEGLGRDDARRMASLYARLGEQARRTNAAQALGYFRRALELVPDNPDYATGYAASLVQAKRFTDAEVVLRKIISVAPDTYAAHANLAAVLDELKRYDEALKEYLWLRTARPELAITDFFIARAHDLLEHYPEALAEYESFLRRADANVNSLEIEKVNLRLPPLREQIKKAKHKR